jgi:hypothetical protein
MEQAGDVAQLNRMSPRVFSPTRADEGRLQRSNEQRQRNILEGRTLDVRRFNQRNIEEAERMAEGRRRFDLGLGMDKRRLGMAEERHKLGMEAGRHGLQRSRKLDERGDVEYEHKRTRRGIMEGRADEEYGRNAIIRDLQRGLTEKQIREKLGNADPESIRLVAQLSKQFTPDTVRGQLRRRREAGQGVAPGQMRRPGQADIPVQGEDVIPPVADIPAAGEDVDPGTSGFRIRRTSSLPQGQQPTQVAQAPTDDIPILTPREAPVSLRGARGTRGGQRGGAGFAATKNIQMIGSEAAQAGITEDQLYANGRPTPKLTAAAQYIDQGMTPQQAFARARLQTQQQIADQQYAADKEIAKDSVWYLPDSDAVDEAQERIEQYEANQARLGRPVTQQAAAPEKEKYIAPQGRGSLAMKALKSDEATAQHKADALKNLNEMFQNPEDNAYELYAALKQHAGRDLIKDHPGAKPIIQRMVFEKTGIRSESPKALEKSGLTEKDFVEAIVRENPSFLDGIISLLEATVNVHSGEQAEREKAEADPANIGMRMFRERQRARERR